MAKKGINIWVALFGLPIAACVLFAISNVTVIVGLVCLAGWYLVNRAGTAALKDGRFEDWIGYLGGWKGLAAQARPAGQHVGPSIRPTPVQTKPADPQPVQGRAQPAGSTPSSAGFTRWRSSAPSYGKSELVGTMECLNWTEADLEALAREAGENLQYALAFRMTTGRDLPDTPRLRALQMTQLAERLRGDMPQAPACRAWPMTELSKGLRLDGLFLAPSSNSPLGLYAFLAGGGGVSRFVVLSLFVPVCSDKAEWARRLFRPGAAELEQERRCIGQMLESIERYVSAD